MLHVPSPGGRAVVGGHGTHAAPTAYARSPQSRQTVGSWTSRRAPSGHGVVDGVAADDGDGAAVCVVVGVSEGELVAVVLGVPVRGAVEVGDAVLVVVGGGEADSDAPDVGDTELVVVGGGEVCEGVPVYDGVREGVPVFGGVWDGVGRTVPVLVGGGRSVSTTKMPQGCDGVGRYRRPPANTRAVTGPTGLTAMHDALQLGASILRPLPTAAHPDASSTATLLE